MSVIRKIILNMDPTREKEVEDEYLSSLMDLNVNSKPLINMLTMLAEESLECAHVIVRAIEKHITQVFKYLFLFHCDKRETSDRVTIKRVKVNINIMRSVI